MRYFSLFAGIGGLEYGLRKKENECVGFSEIKKSSIDIYKKNFGEIKNWGDITKINVKELPEFDILLGGFPCQSFSLAGNKEGFKDKRGKMIFYIYDILKIKKPRYFVLENVKGLVNHNKGKTYENIFELLMFAGYNVRCILLNALYYGSAQNRERVFFLGSLDDFEKVNPEIIDDKKRFRDIREKDGEYKFVNETKFNLMKIEQKGKFNFQLIGGYDRVKTLLAQYGCGKKLVWEDGKFRYLTVKECEKLQGFPVGWTEGKGVSDSQRYWQLGNAVNCDVSKYLFNNYLPKIWEGFN
ncbi:MAG: Modification methylase HhaI [candidate division WS2 bacterium]|uniref:Cytosine-specific methyltransferase n=1 Tax=Psychracetigena formicireducens TaxID=2986056 RepID=A0A9E2F6I1_PSYF1|nr:Modification methylase HhaI [Candidatus Psychracetigena formicireducens]